MLAKKLNIFVDIGAPDRTCYLDERLSLVNLKFRMGE